MASNADRRGRGTGGGDVKKVRDLKIGRRDELRRLPEVNLHKRACARELLPCEFGRLGRAILDKTALL